MKKIRLGNDIPFIWRFFTKDEQGERIPYDMTGRDLTLLMTDCFGNQTDFTDAVTVSENELSWTYYGAVQKRLGAYTLTLVENKGLEDMHTIDKIRPFELVPWQETTESGSIEGAVSVLDVNPLVLESEMSNETGAAVWGRITGDIEEQEDLIELVNSAKAFIITYDGGTETADKTYAEMRQAYEDGRTLILTDGNYYYPMSGISDSQISFCGVPYDERYIVRTFTVSDDDTWEKYQTEFVETQDVQDVLRFTPQTLTNIQKQLARMNIGAAEEGADHLDITYNPNTHTADKSYTEINRAFLFGRNLCLIVGRDRFPLLAKDGDIFNFGGFAYDEAAPFYIYSVNSINVWLVDSRDYAAGTTVTEISEDSTNDGIPTAKAVYDFVQEAGGKVEDVQLNGDSIVENKVANIETEDTDDVEIVTEITASSTNAQLPGAKAVYDLSLTKADKTPVITETAGETTYTIDANKITKLGELASTVAITLNAGETGKAAIYDFIFSTGATAPTITWPVGISWGGGSAPTIAANKTYEVSISEGLALIMEY